MRLPLISQLWDRYGGGALPVVRIPEKVLHLADGTVYRFYAVWLRIDVRTEICTPWLSRKVRRAREANRQRVAEDTRRHLVGERPVQVGDLIPQWAVGYLDQAAEVRDCENTVWKRAVGDERYVREEGELIRDQLYDWIAWSAGEYAGGHCTTEGLLVYAPLTVLKVAR